MPGRRTWVNGTLATSLVAHELGHNLGAHHANALRCGQDASAATLGGACTSIEYGDPFDAMGSGRALMSSWHRAQIGQLPADQQLRVRGSQTVSLTSSSAISQRATNLLLIPRSPGVRRVTTEAWPGTSSRATAPGSARARLPRSPNVPLPVSTATSCAPSMRPATSARARRLPSRLGAGTARRMRVAVRDVPA